MSLTSKDKIFSLPVKNIGKVYLLWYKGNKVHVLFDENKNISSLKFRVDPSDINSIRKTIQEKFRHHTVNPENFSKFFRPISFGEDEKETSFANKRSKTEKPDPVLLQDFTGDLVRQVASNLNLYEIFALMLTSKYMYQSLKGYVLSRVVVKAGRIIESFKDSGVSIEKFEAITLGKTGKIFIKDIFSIEAENEETSNGILTMIRNIRDRFSSLHTLSLTEVNNMLLTNLPNTIKSLSFYTSYSYLDFTINRTLQELTIVALDNPIAQGSGDFEIMKTSLPRSLEILNLKSLGFHARRFIFEGEAIHPNLHTIFCQGELVMEEWPTSLKNFTYIHHIPDDRVLKLPITLEKLEILELSPNNTNIKELPNLKSIKVTSWFSGYDFSFFPRSIETISIKMFDQTQFRLFGLYNGIRELEFGEDRTLLLVEKLPDTLRKLTCSSIKVDPGLGVKAGVLLNEGLEKLHLKDFEESPGALPRSLIDFAVTVDSEYITDRDSLNFSIGFLNRLTLTLDHRISEFPYFIPKSVKYLKLVVWGKLKDLPMGCEGVEHFIFDLQSENYKGEFYLENIKTLELYGTVENFPKTLSPTLKTFIHKEYGGSKPNPPLKDVSYLPTSLEVYEVAEDKFFGKCYMNHLNQLREFSIILTEEDFDHMKNIYYLPDNVEKITVKLVNVSQGVGFNLPKSLKFFFVDTKEEEVNDEVGNRARDVMVLIDIGNTSGITSEVEDFEDDDNIEKVNVIETYFDKFMENQEVIGFVTNDNFRNSYGGGVLYWYE
jgi:hypothetical protein